MDYQRNPERAATAVMIVRHRLLRDVHALLHNSVTTLSLRAMSSSSLMTLLSAMHLIPLCVNQA
ncbi:MAG: hypothetical protein ACRD0K_18115 [Egibacteraceae bacterium]